MTVVGQITGKGLDLGIVDDPEPAPNLIAPGLAARLLASFDPALSLNLVKKSSVAGHQNPALC
jgi:hypothetical protein